MENLSNNNKKRLRHMVGVPLDQKTYNMLAAFAEKENRSVGNAALILLKNSLLSLENNFQIKNYEHR